MSAHTPGPWKVLPSSDCVASSDGQALAVVHDLRDEAAANALLIAAAPEMLHALKSALHAMGSADYFAALALNPHTRELCRRAAEDVSAAITKATGGDR